MKCLLCNVEVAKGRKQTYLLPEEYGGSLCYPCFSRHVIRCGDCGKRLILQPQWAHLYRRYHHVFVCITCSNSNPRCLCGHNLMNSTTVKNRDGTLAPVCKRCAGEPYSSHSHDEEPWDFNPKPWGYNFHSITPDDGAFYGIELETDSYPDRVYPILSDLREHRSDSGLTDFFLKPDGSLQNGIEICFHPRTIPSWVSYITTIFPTLKNIIDRAGGKAYHSNQCGLHIHREETDLATKTKLLFFFAKNRQHLETIAQRRSNSYCSFNVYNQTWTMKQAAAMANLNSRYALNIAAHHGTIEFRLFKGTLAPKTLLAQIGLTDALLQFLQQTSEEVLEDYAKHNNSWHFFMEWVSSIQNDISPFIHEFLTRKGYFTLSTARAQCVS